MVVVCLCKMPMHIKISEHLYTCRVHRLMFSVFLDHLHLTFETGPLTEYKAHPFGQTGESKSPYIYLSPPPLNPSSGVTDVLPYPAFNLSARNPNPGLYLRTKHFPDWTISIVPDSEDSVWTSHNYLSNPREKLYFIFASSQNLPHNPEKALVLSY